MSGKVRQMTAALVLIAGLAAVPFPVLAADRPSDDTVRAWIEESLRDDPRVESSHVTCVSDDGIVTLSGEVRSLGARRYAVLEAKKISGVRGVIDKLTVKPDYRFDADIAGDVRDRFWDSAMTSLHSLDVNVLDGVVTLTGTVSNYTEKQDAEMLASEVRGVIQIQNKLQIHYPDQRTDSQIRTDVLAAFDRDVYLVGLPIEVDVKDGVVTLRGTVGSVYEKDRAGNNAWVGNVVDLHNDLSVEWWEDRGARKQAAALADDEISKAVNDLLIQDLRIADPFRIDVECHYGQLTLHGSVPTYYQRRKAEQDAKNVVGVGWVTNDLVVKSPMRSDETVLRDVQQRLESDYLVNGQDLNVRVNDGVVTLTGNTNTYAERSHAVDVAGRVPGVNSVIDDVDVNWVWRFTDAKLEQRIKDRLKQHDATRWVADRIAVKVTDGVAHLTGDVYTWSERNEAGRIAFLTEGVKAAENGLTVEGISYPWDEWHYPITEIHEHDFYYEPYYG